MRKLLIKLVAIQTILVGWLSYWLFLVYANNPSVAAELGASLQRFPQLSFSTIDIAVMVIIAALAVTLAFKFQRGLRPGIRLERALQMLENLMKRNLVLEAQVAELKIEKSHTPPIVTSVPTSPVTPSEPKEGSWEKAFRTPLGAGPPISSRGSGINKDDIPFGRETGIPPPRIESRPQPSQAMMKPSIMITDKGSDEATPASVMIPQKPVERPSFQSPQKPASSSWEDSPQFIGESKGILTPSVIPRKVPVVSDSGRLRQPYIPAPAPKPVPSVIVGPMISQSPPKVSVPSTPPKITARPTPRTPSPKTSAPSPSPTPAITAQPEPATVLDLPSPQIFPTDKPAETGMSPTGTDVSPPKSDQQVDKADEKTSSKTLQPTRKKPSSDEN